MRWRWFKRRTNGMIENLLKDSLLIKENNDWFNEFITVFERDSLIQKINMLHDDISDIEYDLSPYQDLYAYVVQKSNFNGTVGYEVIKQSGIHCILITTETEFSSKGWFSMKVAKAFPVEVTVEGGFTQQWDTYIEAPQASITEMNNSKVQLKKLEKQLAVVERKINSW